MANMDQIVFDDELDQLIKHIRSVSVIRKTGSKVTVGQIYDRARNNYNNECNAAEAQRNDEADYMFRETDRDWETDFEKNS